MPFCGSCGNPIGDFDTVCKNCGTPVRNARTNAPAPAAPPVVTYPVSTQNAEPPKGSPYAVLSSWGFVGSMLLMAIPIAGFIIMIVWAAGATSNHNRRNLARGCLLTLAILLALYLILIIYAVIIYGSVSPIYSDFWNL
mgnify:CR=1 FL=1